MLFSNIRQWSVGEVAFVMGLAIVTLIATGSI